MNQLGLQNNELQQESFFLTCQGPDYCTPFLLESIQKQ